MPFSKLPDHPCPDWLTSLPIAHRGLHAAQVGIPENSLASFEQAINSEVAIEFDLRFSKDGEIFVFHDADLQRMTDQTGAFNNRNAEDLCSLMLVGSRERIPTFRETLDLVNGQVPLVIELKPVPQKRAQTIELVLQALAGYEGLFSIQSFDPFLLLELRKQAPRIIRGQLGMKDPPFQMSAYRRFMLRTLPLNSLTKPHYIGYDVHSIETVAAQRAAGAKRPLLAWTVKSDADLAKANRYANNVIFENLTPDIIRQKRQ